MVQWNFYKASFKLPISRSFPPSIHVKLVKQGMMLQQATELQALEATDPLVRPLPLLPTQEAKADVAAVEFHLAGPRVGFLSGSEIQIICVWID